MQKGRISRASAKALLLSAYEDGSIPEKEAEKRDLWLIGDKEVLRPIVKKVLEDNPKALSEYRSGKLKNKQFLLGQAMRETKGKADPSILEGVLQEYLESE